MEQIIYKKMSEIFKDVEFIGKTKKNQQQGFNFRGIDDMYNELHDLFAKHEVFIISEVQKITREERQTKSGGNLIYTILEVKISFFACDGSSVSSVLIGEAMDSADKSANKAMSAALKYALMQTFLIPTEELKDADLTTPDPSKPLKPEAAIIETWMSEKQYTTLKERLSSTEKEIYESGLRNYDAFCVAPFGMKKEFKSELEKIVKMLRL